jgi:hypothetical protein
VLPQFGCVRQTGHEWALHRRRYQLASPGCDVLMEPLALAPTCGQPMSLLSFPRFCTVSFGDLQTTVLWVVVPSNTIWVRSGGAVKFVTSLPSTAV